MDETNEVKKIKKIGKVCNVLSVILTILLCLPIPIIFIFLKNIKRYFSILFSFENFLAEKISLETLKKHMKHIFLRLALITIIFLCVAYALFSENNSNDFEMRGNLIFATCFLILILPCYYNCFKVNEYIKTT